MERMNLTVSGWTNVTNPNIRFCWYGILTSCTGPNLLQSIKKDYSIRITQCFRTMTLKMIINKLHFHLMTNLIRDTRIAICNCVISFFFSIQLVISIFLEAAFFYRTTAVVNTPAARRKHWDNASLSNHKPLVE